MKTVLEKCIILIEIQAYFVQLRQIKNGKGKIFQKVKQA